MTDSNAGVIYYGRGGTPFGGGGIRAQLADPVNCNHFGVCQSGVSLATHGGDEARLNDWINGSAFTGAPCIGGTIQGECATSGGATGFGDSAIGSVMGPGQNNWDFSLMKTTKLTEGLSFQFRTEFYNIWNHAQFNPPVNNFGAATFGQIQSSSVPPRIMQFAVKFLF